MAKLAGGISVASIHDSINNMAPSTANGATAAATNDDSNGDANDGAPLGGEGVLGEGADGGGGGSPLATAMATAGAGAAAAGEGSAAAAAVAAASASRVGVAGEARTAADGGGEIWVEPPVVVKKYNKVRCGRVVGGRGAG